MWSFSLTGGNGMELASSDAMAARDALPVLNVLFLFFTGRPHSFLSQKNGGAKKTGRPMAAHIL